MVILAVPIFLLERFIPELYAQILWITLILTSAGYFYTVNQQTKHSFGFGLRSIFIFLLFFYGANSAYILVNPQSSFETPQKQHSIFTPAKDLIELKEIVKSANAEGKTVMVDLYADWCIACKEFEKYTFPKAIVQQALANTLLVQMDLTDLDKAENKAVMSQYDLFGLPSILFFDLQGNELPNRRVTGFMGAEEFANHIEVTFK